MRSVRFHDYGPPEVLQVDEVPEPAPGQGELLIRVTGAGISYAEVQIRGGVMRQFDWFPDPPMPCAPGYEVAGEVIGVGPGAGEEWIGRKVVGPTAAGAGYSELALMPAAAANQVPEGLDDQTALALLSQGAVAVGVAETAAIRPKDVVLVTAAAGGVGSLLVQLAKRAGAEVIGLASGERKLALAKQLGADHVLDYTQDGWDAQVREISGAGVQVALESTGGAVSRKVFDLLAFGYGRMVVYGTASGAMPQFDPESLYTRGVTVGGFGPRLFLEPEYGARLRKEAFDLALGGELRPVIGQVLPLSDAALAHRAFEERTTVGKAILVP